MREVGFCLFDEGRVGGVAGEVGQAHPFEDEGACGGEPVVAAVVAAGAEVEVVPGDAGGGVEGVGEGVGEVFRLCEKGLDVFFLVGKV